MSITQSNVTQQVQKAALTALVEVANAGMAASYHSRYDFEVVGHGMRQREPQSAPVHIPAQFKAQYQSVFNSGVFFEMSLTEALLMCFTPEALALLVRHTYNEYAFWTNLKDVCSSFYSSSQKEQMPFGEKLVQDRLFPAYLTPFGVKTATSNDFHMARLTDAVRKNNGVFDPNKLPAPYAVKLLMSGFLLNVKQEDYAAAPSLMVNPRWQHVIDQIIADAAKVPSTPAAPAPARGILYAQGKITGGVEVELCDGYSSADLLGLLNSGKARVEVDSVLVPLEAPAEGSMVIATVINPRPSFLMTNPLAWSTEKPADQAVATTADITEPASKRLKLSALGKIYGEIEVEATTDRGLNEIAELLTQYRAQIADGSVLLPHAAPAEGMTVIGKILSKQQFPTPVGTVVWSIAG